MSAIHNLTQAVQDLTTSVDKAVEALQSNPGNDAEIQAQVDQINQLRDRIDSAVASLPGGGEEPPPVPTPTSPGRPQQPGPRGTQRPPNPPGVHPSTQMPGQPQHTFPAPQRHR